MRDLSSQGFDRILIIKPSSFGDVIHALPILDGLRRRYPDARISWLVSTACAGLLHAHPQLDEAIPFDRKRYGRIGRSLSITLEFLRFTRELRARRFDLVIDLQGLFRSGFLAWASGAKVRVGLSDAREFSWIFHTHCVHVPAGDMHAVDRYWLVAGLLGFADRPVHFELAQDSEAKAAIRSMLAEGGLADGQGYALLVPGTRWETKLWPAEFFAEAARMIRDQHGLPVVLAGAPDEVEIAGRVASLAGNGVINLAGRTSVAQMIALVAGASVAIMNDTGPMHLAAALGRPLVTVFGPTSPVKTGPYRRMAGVCRLDLACSPCYLKRLAECPHGHRCMKELSPATVADRVGLVLRQGNT